MVALVMSSCFSLRAIKFSKTSVFQGEKVTAILSLYPHSTTGSPDVPFVLIGHQWDANEESDFTVTNPLQFDTKGNFPAGPRELSSDNALRTAALTSGGCDIEGFDPGEATGFIWTAVRTGSQVNDGGKINKVALTKIGIKAHIDASTGSRRLIFISGRWNDDDDGIPEGAELSCTGVFVSSIPVKNAPE